MKIVQLCWLSVSSLPFFFSSFVSFLFFAVFASVYHLGGGGPKERWMCEKD